MLPSILVMLLFWGPIIGGGLYFLRRFVRAAEQRSGAPSELLALSDRVAALELALDEARTEIRHLTEGQEFTVRLLDAKATSGRPETSHTA